MGRRARSRYAAQQRKEAQLLLERRLAELKLQPAPNTVLCRAAPYEPCPNLNRPCGIVCTTPPHARDSRPMAAHLAGLQQHAALARRP